MKNKESIIKYLKVIKRSHDIILALLSEEDDIDGDVDRILHGIINSKDSEEGKTHKSVEKEPSRDMRPERLKHIRDLLSIDCWPTAVSHEVVQKDPTDLDQLNRANAVLDVFLNRDVKGVNFLDFGCGEGWIASSMRGRGVKYSAGFDIVENEKWGQFDGVEFFTNFDKIPKNNFDIILLYDVLDHCDNPLKVMSQVTKLLNPNGTVYVRCHPFTSKHGSHLFKKGLNKAYINLFLTNEEIKDVIGESPDFVKKEINPIGSYRWWFNSFDIINERIIKEPVSDFFKIDDFKNLIMNENSIEDIDEFLKTMEIQFVDYTLSLKK